MTLSPRAERAAAEAERAAERRAATVAAIQAAPDIADRMTGVGLHGLPLPDDAVPDGNFLVTRVATPEALMAFYIEHMRASGWTLDLDHSNPLTKTGHSCFRRSATSHARTSRAATSRSSPAQVLMIPASHGSRSASTTTDFRR